MWTEAGIGLLVLLAVLTGSALALVLGAELFGRTRHVIRSGKISNFFAKPPVPPNEFMAAVGGGKKPFSEYLLPHPHVGYVFKPGEVYRLAEKSGTRPTVNRDGFMDAEWSALKDPGTYTILVTGGSVAALLLLDATIKFQQSIADRFTASDGRPVRVLNGALGGWKQPQQLMLSQIMATRIDAVATLEGFNELGAIGAAASGGHRMDQNAMIQKVLLTMGTDAESLAQRARSGKMTHFVQNHPFLKHVYLASFYEKHLARKAAKIGPTVEFETPWKYGEGVSAEAAMNESTAAYRSYLLMMAGAARQAGLRFLAMLQPCPAIGKALTPEEETVAGSLKYKRLYETLVETFKSLREQGIAAEDFTDVFENVAGTVYVDKIHMNREGNTLLAARATEAFVKAFGLKAKQPAVAATTERTAQA